MKLYKDIKQWEEVSSLCALHYSSCYKIGLVIIIHVCLNTTSVSLYFQALHIETEKFGGEILLEGEESLYEITKRMEGWTDCALKVFGRHRSEDGANYPDHELMMTMNLVREE